MNQLTWVGIILTLTYSFEELKNFSLNILRLILKNKHVGYKSKKLTDQIVGDFVLILMVPITLSITLANSSDLSKTLTAITFETFLIYISYEAIKFVVKNTSILSLDGWSESVQLVSPFINILHPTFRPAQFYKFKNEFNLKFLLLFGSAALLGSFLLSLVRNSVPELLVPNLVSLIMILVTSLIALITIEYLAPQLKKHRLSFWSYLRITICLILSAYIMVIK